MIGDVAYFLGLLAMSLGIISGVMAAGTGEPVAWFIPVCLLFAGSMLLTRARREQVREDR